MNRLGLILAAGLVLLFVAGCAQRPSAGGEAPTHAPAGRILATAASDSSDAVHREPPSTRPSTTAPAFAEIRRGMRYSPTTNPAERQRRRSEMAARVIEPSLHGSPDRLGQYLEIFRREFVRDPRLFAFSASATQASDGRIILAGYAEYPEHREALESVLKRLGFENIENRIEQLPAAALGEEKYALVTASRTFVYDRPEAPRETVTECVLGDGLFLLKATDDGKYLLCHGPDGYVGYVAAADVRRVSAATLHAYESGRQIRVIGDCEAGGGRFVPTGARLKLKFDDDRLAVAESPDGKSELSLPAERVMALAPRPSERAERAINAAIAMTGTHYVWGGKTSRGVDCSGLVQSSFRAQGVNLPRDADQQAYVGAFVATRWDLDGLRRGDTLYFLSRRGAIHHTAIYLGDGKFIEAAGKGVKITSLRKGDPEYDDARAKSFCFARRILE